VPLALAVGAGAEMRSTLGIAVFAGMLGVTIFDIFLTPVFYYVITSLLGSPVAAHAAAVPHSDGNSKPPAPMHGDGPEEVGVGLADTK
jgi:multidrug efflux pump